MLNFSYLLLSTVYFQSESKKKTLLNALNIFILSVLAVFFFSLYVSNYPTKLSKTKENNTKEGKQLVS